MTAVCPKRGSRTRGKPKLRYNDICKASVIHFSISHDSKIGKTSNIYVKLRGTLYTDAALFEGEMRAKNEEKRRRWEVGGGELDCNTHTQFVAALINYLSSQF